MRARRRQALAVALMGTSCTFDPAGVNLAPAPVDAGAPIDVLEPPPPDAAPICPADWIASGASCYRVVELPGFWPAARDACTDLGGHLVIIADADENARVRALSTLPSTWIGATDVLVEDDWRWVDGSAVTFQPWAPLQPDNFLNEDCIVQQEDGAWNDTSCERELPFVCERDPV